MKKILLFIALQYVLYPFCAFAEDICISCHGDTKRSITMNQHASKGIACTTCHGEAKGHIEDPDVRDFIAYGKKDQTALGNDACLSCHRKSRKMMNWEGSAHQNADLSCASCHTVHAEVPEKVQAERCYSCHKDIRRDAAKLSHHPIREGKMSCSSCHDAHGSLSPKLLTKNTVNELCISCHTEKRGPYRFSHAPVEENCLTCHSAHGTSAPRLLTQNIRSTCTNCHVFGRKRNLASEELGSRAPAMMQRGTCINCHGSIHGSNTDFRFL